MDKTDVGLLAGFVGFAVSLWLGLSIAMQALVVLMVADVVTGLLAGGKAGELDSDVSYRGMRKKAMQCVLVGLTTYLGALAPINLPLGEGVAWAFCATEVLSVIENAARLGVTMPDPVVAALKRLGSTQQGGQA
jgi:toxin secretion/phage lysis holin